MISPAEQPNEISGSKKETVALVPAQPLEEVQVPAAPQPTVTVGMAPASPQSEPPTAALTTEIQGQAAVTDVETPRTTGRSENRPPEAKNKKKSKAVTKRKDPRPQEVDSAQTERAEGDRTSAGRERSDARQKTAVQQKTVVQKAKRKEPEQQEVETDAREAADSESRDVVYERVPARRGYDRGQASRENARGRVTVDRDRLTVDRERDWPQQREADREEPRQGFGLFDVFDR